MTATKRRAAPKRASTRKKAVQRAARRAKATGKKVRRSTIQPRRTRVTNSRRSRTAKAKSGPKRAIAKKTARRPPATSARKVRRPARSAVVRLPGTILAAVPAPVRAKKVVRAKKPAPPFRAADGASAKQQLVFEMVQARVAVQAAIQGLQPLTVEQRPGAGEWTVRDHALHLCHWDAEVGRLLESALHGIRPSWDDFDQDDLDRFNAAGIEELRSLSWDDVRRLLMTSRMDLMETLESIPESPDEVWKPPHPFAAMLKDLAWNDRHHADIIKRWRLERGA